MIFEHRSRTADNGIGGGMVDLNDKGKWIPLGTSRARCWQQGFMLLGDFNVLLIFSSKSFFSLVSGGRWQNSGPFEVARANGASGIVRKRSMLWAVNPKQRHEKQETNPQCGI